MATRTSVAAAARTHPCLRGAFPVSATQPGLTSKAAYFTVTSEGLTIHYPYDVPPSQGKKLHVTLYRVPYCEISGRGPPPADLTGAILGDVYIDLSPAEYAVYGRVANSGTPSIDWKRWYDPQPGHKNDATVVKHPYFRSRYLWCSNATGVSWFASTTVTTIQERAKKAGLVSAAEGKTEETRWREAAAIIGPALEPAGPSCRKSKGTTSTTRVTVQSRLSTSPLSETPPTESREPSPVPISLLGKRKTRSHGGGPLLELGECGGPTAASVEAKRYKALLRGLIQRMKAEKVELAEEICALEKHLSPPQQPSVPESKEFSEWQDKIVSDAIQSRRQALDPSVREYWDLKAELEADDAERSKGESILEDTQILLGLTISEHKQLKQLEARTGAGA